MSFMLTRMFAYFTLVMYLFVGSVCLRVLMPEMTTIAVSTSYLTLFSETKIKSSEIDALEAPEIKFAAINFPAETNSKVKKITHRKLSPMKMEKVAKNELPFHEPVKLGSVYMNKDLPVNLASLYIEFKYEMIAQSSPILDEISTKLASSEEPQFFEYDDVKTDVKDEAPVTQEITYKSEEAKPEETDKIEKISQLDNQELNQPDSNEVISEQVELQELVAFDYSKAKEDIKAQGIPTIGTVTSQPAKTEIKLSEIHKSENKKPNQKVTTQNIEVPKSMEKNSLLMKSTEMPKTYPSHVTIQLAGTNLKETKPEVGFEIKFQDDLNEAVQDYNMGKISLEQELSESKMTRSLVVLKRGFAPTNTDLILEEGVAELSLPIIDESTFNELMAPFESRGPIGAVLIELSENVEEASLDVPYSQVLRLDEKMQITEGTDYVYQLFVGVKAGNALLSYKDMDEKITSKIIHIHEREVTFESNIFEVVVNERIQLLEEDLMGKEKTPLIISSDEIKHFATDKTPLKINDHTYRTSFKKTVLGGRRYLELTHQAEPVLGNRCLVQINLKKKALSVEVAAESVAASLMTKTQVLDANGKFYDSIGAKSQKIIIVGEGQGAPGISNDGKINVKLNYQDGSVQYLGTYCSPNTYLVEQL
jgi:hypothetical protein